MSTILLVEDNEINRDMLSRRLERKGYTVIIAVNGAEGVAKTLSDQPDIVLMDMHLPILDGWEATRQIKANPQTRVVPVIALTADAIVGEREKALAAGCDDYDTKPVDLPRLLAKITKLLEPVVVPQPPARSFHSPTDRHLQRSLLTRLRQQFDPHIHQIIGYSDLLLDILRDRQQPALTGDIQKIHASGLQLLRLVQAMLNPVLAEIQRQGIDLFAPALRLEILTPLSTIIGYSEMLLEEATADLIPDLEQIYAAAQALLSMANNLDSLVNRLTAQQPVDPVDPDQKLIPAYLTVNDLWPIESPIAANSRILVIDDDEANGKLRSRQLEQHGSIVAVSNTQQALSTLSTQPHTLILLDVSLGTGGLKVLAQIQQEHPQIPVLILAAPDEIDRVVSGIALGAADYLTKPIQSVLLWTKVIDCLSRNQPAQHDNFHHDLVENALIGIYQATATGQYSQVNPALVELLGYPDPETLLAIDTDFAVGVGGASAEASRHENRIYVDRDRYAEFKSLLEAHDRVIGFEYQAYRYDGDPIWVAEHARAIRDADGKLVSYEGLVTDISPSKLAEAALNSQLAAVQIELDNLKRSLQVTEIVQTEYFQQLQDPNSQLPTPRSVPSEVSAAPADRSSLPLKVLLVEDNELNRDMLSRRLLRSGYAVTIATDGAEGVMKARSEQPDIILMDISLPVMDGWEATQQLKANSQTAQIPIIALTAHAMAGDREKALAAGCDDYDTKPIELPRLLGKIEGCLRQGA
jgi:PAS domain S-box-containing protein